MTTKKTAPPDQEIILGATLAIRTNDLGDVRFIFLDEDDNEHSVYWSELDKGWRVKLRKVLDSWK